MKTKEQKQGVEDLDKIINKMGFMCSQHLDRLEDDGSTTAIDLYDFAKELISNLSQSKEGEWINTEKRKPKFDELVLVWCRVYGKFLATYEEIDSTGFGNWRDMKGNLGILPPICWMPLPQPPKQ